MSKKKRKAADLPQKMAELIGLTHRRPRRRQSNLPRNLHTAPGTLHISPEELPPKISVMAYGPDGVEERVITSVSEFESISDAWPVLWVNVEGLGDPTVLKQLATRFNLHPLAMEDVADTTQRAKVEPYDGTTFVILPLPHRDERGFWTEQLSMFITPKFVITFQSAYSGDCLDALRMRVRAGKGRLRTANAPYLAYCIADATIDGYFPIVNHMGDLLEGLEDAVLTNPSAAQLASIRQCRTDLLRLRRAVFPMRDAMAAFAALDHIFDAETRPYLRDLNDHVYRLLDQLETDRFLASDLLDVYMTSLNLRLGETTKVLTIIATIFIPLSFIASVYGMNFKHFPETEWLYGYPFALGLMGLTAGAFLTYFWRKGWLRNTANPRVRGSTDSNLPAPHADEAPPSVPAAPADRPPHPPR